MNFSVTLQSTSSWTGGGNGNIVITNNNTSPLTNWSFQLNTINFTISSFWALSMNSSGNNITVLPSSWQLVLNAGGTISSGFAYSGSSNFQVTSNTPGINLTILPSSSGNNGGGTNVPISNAPALTNKNMKVMAYYTEWCIYHSGFNVDLIPVQQLTHILYAFMMPNPSQADYDLWAANWAFPAKPYNAPPIVPEGTLIAQDQYANDLNMASLKALKARNPNVKIIISVGGWSMSFNFSTIFADASLRRNFVTSSVKFVVSNGFDGLDIDWEYPGIQGIGFNHVDAINDPKNLALVLKELKAEFIVQSPNKTYELLVAMGTNQKVIVNYKDSVQYLDYINMMTYDYAGSWGNGGHLAGLYYNPEEVDIDPQWNVDNAFKNTLAMGCPLSKINLGLPLYGRGWANIKPTNIELPLFGTSTAGAATTYSGLAGEPGLTAFKDLVNVINTNGLKEYYDPIAKASFVHNSSTGETWTYDNPQSVALKTQYALDNKMAGIFVWELSEDTRTNDNNLLTTAINVINSTGSTGSSGSTGNTGNTGSTGSTGSTGNTGTTGSSGSTGQTGITGTTGTTGSTGIIESNITVVLQSTNSWNGGGNGSISITNNSTKALTNWSFNLNTIGFTIQNFWTLSMSGSGNTITVKPATWALTIQPGQTLISGFGYFGSSIFSANTSSKGVIVSVINAIDPTSLLNLTVSVVSTSFWNTGGNGLISITNNSKSSLNSWSFQLNTNNFTIQSLWQLSFSGSNSNLTISPASWGTIIAPGVTVTSGFAYIGSSSKLNVTTTTSGVTIKN